MQNFLFVNQKIHTQHGKISKSFSCLSSSENDSASFLAEEYRFLYKAKTVSSQRHAYVKRDAVRVLLTISQIFIFDDLMKGIFYPDKL